MICADVMRPVEFVAPGARLRDAAALMRAANVGFLPVCDEGRVVAGVVTDRDLVVRALADGRGPDTPVTEVMTRQVVTCAADDELEEAARLMSENQVQRIVVLDADERLAGVVSLSDLPANAADDAVSDAVRRVAERDAALP